MLFRFSYWVPRARIAILLHLGLVLVLGNAVAQKEGGDEVLAGRESDLPRMNQIQLIGTHNSYHIAPHPTLLGFIGTLKKEWKQALDYTHRPLPVQLEELGMRHFELDVFADPRGGLFSNPRGISMVNGIGVGGEAVPRHDPQGELRKPGMKILHHPDFDYDTTVLTLKSALGQILAWSRKHPRHVPVLVLLELKDERLSLLSTKPVPFTKEMMDALDKEILSVVGKDRIITPDLVRGEFASLREAVTTKGWPSLDSVRGKLIFALDNGGELRDRYVEEHESLKGRVLFASMDDEKSPSAAWFKLNDPVGDFDRIRRLVESGFLVRTRADADTRQARANDATRRDKALASGAQFISTDYPEADERFSEYRVVFPGGVVARPNPVAAPPGDPGGEME